MKKLTIKFNDGSQVRYEMKNSVDTMPYFNRHIGSIKHIESAIFQQYPKNKNEAVILVRQGKIVTRITDEKLANLKDTAVERALVEAHDLFKNPIEPEDLKLFAFDDEETTYVIADNMDNAIGHFATEVGDDVAKCCIVTEIEDWHDRTISDDEGKESTFLMVTKEYCKDGYLNPFTIAATYV